MKLISKTKGASVSTKTKNVIVEGNVNSSKVTHQRNSGIVHLTKRTERNESSLIFPEGIKGVSRHENSAKAFSRYQSWYNFNIFKSLSGHQHGVPYFNPREEQSLPVSIVGNDVLLRAFVNHYDRFQEEFRSEDGDGLNVSSMILSVCLAYDVWIVLQDAPLWFKHYPDHWITKYIGNCINRIKDEDMQREIKVFMFHAIKNIKIIEEEHDMHLRQNSIKESNINQHTSNCVSKIGVQVSTIHSDNVNQNIILKNLVKEVKNQNKMCMLTTKLVAKQNVGEELLPADLLKCWKECKGEPSIPDNQVLDVNKIGVSNEKNNDFYQQTSVSDHLLTCGEVDLNEKLGWATNVGCIIEGPHEVVDWWFDNRLCNEIRKGSCKRLGKAVYNNLHRKKNYMETIFWFATKLFPDMINEELSCTSKDLKWKNHLTHAGLKMNEERVKTKYCGKVMTPNNYFKMVRQQCRQHRAEMKKKLTTSILPFATSNNHMNNMHTLGQENALNKSKASLTNSSKVTLNHPNDAPICMEAVHHNAILNESEIMMDSNMIVEENEFEQVAKSTSLQFKEGDVRLSQWSQSSFLSQNSDTNVEANEKEIDSVAKAHLNNSSCASKGKGFDNSVTTLNCVASKARSEVHKETTALLNVVPLTQEKEATLTNFNLNNSSENTNKNNVHDYVTGGKSLSQLSMSQIENEARAFVDNEPLSQEMEVPVDRGMENIANDDLSFKTPELLIGILDTMLQVSNEEFVNLHFQWKLCLLHENEWWVNATHNNRNRINRKHLSVLSRVNHLELEVMKKHGTDFYSKLSLLDLRTNLREVCSITVSVSNLKKTSLLRC